MGRVLLALSLVFCAFVLPAQSQGQTKAPGHYMFAWTGDVAMSNPGFPPASSVRRAGKVPCRWHPSKRDDRRSSPHPTGRAACPVPKQKQQTAR